MPGLASHRLLNSFHAARPDVLGCRQAPTRTAAKDWAAIGLVVGGGDPGKNGRIRNKWGFLMAAAGDGRLAGIKNWP